MSEPSRTGQDEVRWVLEERARRLARPPAPPRPTDVIEAVAFQLGAERYAVDATRVQEVFRLQARSALPGAPDPIAGVTAHRGELLTLLDLRATLGLPVAALNDLTRVLVIARGRSRAGVLVDTVEGVMVIPRADLLPAAPHGSTPREYLIGFTRDALAVLNVEALLRLFDGGEDS